LNKMTDRFTGGDNLTANDGLKYYIHKTMMLNELNGGNGAYRISNAQNAASGPSFGPIQYDLGANQAGRDLFESIARSATNADGTRIISDVQLKQIQDNLYKPFSDMTAAEKAVYTQLKPAMDSALASAEGKSQINADYSRVLDSKVAHVNAVVDGVTNPTNRAYLQGDLKSQVMIADIANQYGTRVNQKLSDFLSQTSADAGVQLPGDGKLVKVSGPFDSSDIHNFRLATAYGVNHPADANRRDANIDAVVGTNKLSVTEPDPANGIRVATVDGKLNKETFTVAYSEAGIPSIYKSPEMTPPPLATLTKPISLEGVGKLLKETPFLTGLGTPAPSDQTREQPAPSVRNDLQQPSVQPRM
jgi:hypothetical protein